MNGPFQYEQYKKIVRPKYCMHQSPKACFFLSLIINWFSSLCVQLVSSLWFLVNLFLSHTSLLMFNQSNHIQRKGEHAFTLGVAEEDNPPPRILLLLDMQWYVQSCSVIKWGSNTVCPITHDRSKTIWTSSLIFDLIFCIVNLILGITF